MNNYSQPESHTHLQFAPANAATKNCKRVCLALALTDRKTKHMGITKCINHWAESAGFKCITFNQLRSGLTGKCFEMPNASYT